MDRRDFFKILTTSSAGLIGGACSSSSDKLIPLLVPEKEIVPGEEAWHPSICSECEAGCGVIVRVMRGEHIIERKGEKLREPVAAIKKIEGNPLDPVSGGRLCARGQAMVQGLYNPDRLQGPRKRTGTRGKDQFAALTWDEAIADAAGRISKAKAADPNSIVFLTGVRSGTRAVATQRFLEAIGAPTAVTCSISDFPLESKAAEMVFGWQGLPVYDLGRATYALGIGADFLGSWASPVFYGRQFGHFRQGRQGIRGKLVQAQSRFSVTVQAADQWLPVAPGAEPHLAIAIMRILIDDKLARNADGLPKSVADKIRSADLAALIKATGVEEKKLRQVAHELGKSDSPVVIAGASSVHSNSLDALVAASYLNILLGNVGKPGGVLPPAADATRQPERRNVLEALSHAKVIIIDNVNPAYILPASTNITSLLSNAESIISFSPYLDDTGVYADLLLPDHHSLESTAAVVPAVSLNPAVNVSTPFVQPLYDTRATEQTLADIAKKMDLSFDAATPKSVFEKMLPADATWDNVTREGGLWLEASAATPVKHAAKPAAKKEEAGLEWSDPVFAGDASQFPYHFQPYLSVQYQDGRGANLPWMQEMPDPTSSAMWGLPLEVNPKTAAQLQLSTGDILRVESQFGKLEAPVYVHPAAMPNVISMGIGEGHTSYGRYASGRGVNPLAILGNNWEKSTGALAFGSTRVRLTRVGKSSELIQFSHNDRDHGPFGEEHR